MADLLIGRVKRMDNLIDGILHNSRIGRIQEKHEMKRIQAITDRLRNNV